MFTNERAGKACRTASRPIGSSPHRLPLRLPQKRNPWPQVPMHLLSQASPGRLQVRHSSSDSRNSPEDASQSSSDISNSSIENKHDNYASSFGFQSLSGLFSEPERRRRYSRPREPNSEESASASSTESRGVETSVERTSGKIDEAFFRPSPTSSNDGSSVTSYSGLDGRASVVNDPKESNSNTKADLNSTAGEEIESRTDAVRIRQHYKKVEVDGKLQKPRREEGTRSHLLRRGISNVQTDETGGHNQKLDHSGMQGKSWRTLARPSGKKVYPQRQPAPNPFVLRRKDTSVRVQARQLFDAEKPWGLSQEDLATVESKTDPNFAMKDFENESTAVSPQKSQVKGPSPSERKTFDQSVKKLTHVTSSGEARMVDVGAKPNSRRVAIALSTIVFHNPESFRLIIENSNKKGDVLGVARIAGIMAAKRTSDLVPLCHPIAITKVEVDAKILAPGVPGLFYTGNKRGGVTAQALVECVGPTGVEMEALTASIAAVLTVYDMCKAVDRDMRIRSSVVTYKNGGKSGLHYDPRWAKAVGREFFLERELEVPPMTS